MAITTMQTLIDGVKEYAVAHYEDGGWDVIVECWSDDEIAAYINSDGTITTVQQAVMLFETTLVEVWADQQADAAQYHENPDFPIDYDAVDRNAAASERIDNLRNEW